MKEMMSQIYRVSLILHKTPKETMTMSRDEMESLWEEHVDMNMEMTTGKRRPKLYEYEREALDKLKERFK